MNKLAQENGSAAVRKLKFSMKRQVKTLGKILPIS